jgi:hypothetical protein
MDEGMEIKRGGTSSALTKRTGTSRLGLVLGLRLAPIQVPQRKFVMDMNKTWRAGTFKLLEHLNAGPCWVTGEVSFR